MKIMYKKIIFLALVGLSLPAMEQGADDVSKATSAGIRGHTKQKKKDDERKESGDSNMAPTDEHTCCSCDNEYCQICLIGCGTALSTCLWAYATCLYHAHNKGE